MPGMPPNARRSERIADYARHCGPVPWEERRIRAADGTDLALCVASVVATGPASPTSSAAAAAGDAIPVYILYFQGLPCFPLPALRRAAGCQVTAAHTTHRKRLVAATPTAGPFGGPAGLAEKETTCEVYHGLSELSRLLDLARPALREGDQC